MNSFIGLEGFIADKLGIDEYKECPHVEVSEPWVADRPNGKLSFNSNITTGELLNFINTEGIKKETIMMGDPAIEHVDLSTYWMEVSRYGGPKQEIATRISFEGLAAHVNRALNAENIPIEPIVIGYVPLGLGLYRRDLVCGHHAVFGACLRGETELQGYVLSFEMIKKFTESI